MLRSVDIVVGYTKYIELIRGLIGDTETFDTGMKGEKERAMRAVELAGAGRRVAIVSSGDAGIYGMAGLVLEIMKSAKEPGDFHFEVVPGLPAFVSAASTLGAPLMHDFASISLSDLLTPWKTITRRIEAAAMADFVIALYNPKSRGRTTQLPEAVEIIRGHREPATPVGIVKDSSRSNERVITTTLAALSDFFDEIDMSTSIIIGNSATFMTTEERMVTPRGYQGL